MTSLTANGLEPVLTSIDDHSRHNETTNGVGSSSDDIPVLIVGAGPTGLFLSHLLSQLGVRSLVVEKYPTRLAAPKAHVISPRSMEISRQFGLDTNAMRCLGSPRKDAFWVNFVTNLSGQRIGVLPFERMEPEVLNDTPEMVHNIPQPRFEKFVADQLINDQQVEIRKGVGFVSCSEENGQVTTTVEERDSKARYRIRSQYVVACDGAKSAVREHLGIECEGEDSYETMMTIHINADLRPVLGEKVGTLHWIMDPAVSGFIIGYDLSDNQVLICNFDSKKHPIESWNNEFARSVVSTAIGKDIPFDLLSYRPWILSRKIAKKFHQDNVFLCGDAAHAFPPTGGLGLNCGLADVHNLAYKLAANLQGWGGRKLLESYGAERRHVADIYSTQSVKNGNEIFSFLKTLGVGGIEDVNEARKNLLKSINDPTMQRQIKEGVEGQREHFSNLELHIGYVYGRKEKPRHASHYTPKFVPGARLPHAWISPEAFVIPAGLAPVDTSYVWEFSPSEVRERQYSTLDLCPKDAFTLIVGHQIHWVARFEEIAERLSKHKVKLQLCAVDHDFEFVLPEQRKIFEEQASLASGGGLLIRPDQHILMNLSQLTTDKEIAVSILDHLGLWPVLDSAKI